MALPAADELSTVKPAIRHDTPFVPKMKSSINMISVSTTDHQQFQRILNRSRIEPHVGTLIDETLLRLNADIQTEPATIFYDITYGGDNRIYKITIKRDDVIELRVRMHTETLKG